MKRNVLILLLALLVLLSGCAGIMPETPESPETPHTDPLPEAPKEPTEAELAEARLREQIAAMSLEEKVGQMFFVRCPETDAETDIQQYHFGGLLLFGRDFKDSNKNWLTAEAFTEKLRGYQAAASIPLFIGSDEEGGTVTRASQNPNLFAERFRSPQELAASANEPDNVFARDAKEKCSALLHYGINVNFAPVCDVSTDPNDFIYARTLGKSAEETSAYVKSVLSGMDGTGVAAVLKHFPGYGNNADTHTGIAIDKRPYEVFEQSDFLPFQAGIAAGAPFVLVSHNIVECMDAELPASLSPAVHTLLRETLGFSGIVITDDLAMDAVKDYADGEAAVLAVLAGNDMLITSDYQNDISAVLTAVAAGRISESSIDEHVFRILQYKQSQGWVP